MNKTMPHLKDKCYGGAWSIHDLGTVDFRMKMITHLSEMKLGDGNINDFLRDYREWIRIVDFKNFPHMNFSHGTTETFDKFYLRHLDKPRLRLLKGEYFYHQIMARNYFKDFDWLDEKPIEKGDVVVMSCPFSDTGNIPKDFSKILEQCENLNVPVMLDLAYINISDIEYLDLNYKCIETVTTSLSKVFPVEHDRIGIRFEREIYDDTMVAYNQNRYINLLSVNLGHQFIRKYKRTWLYDNYKQLQSITCQRLNLTPSNTVIFGIDYDDQYSEYNRGGSTNRLCFSKLWDNRIKNSGYFNNNMEK